VRKLMWFTIGFTAACAAGVYLLSGIWIALAGLFCLLCGIVFLFLRTKPAKITAVVLLGCVVGFAWLWGYDDFYLSDAKGMDAQTTELTVTVSDYGFTPAYGEAFDGTVELDGRSFQIRCYLKEQYGVAPGDRITGSFRLRYTASGGESDPTYHQGKGIFLLAYAQDAVFHEKAESVHWSYYPAVWREKIQSTIKRLFPADTAAFAKALLLGDTTDLTYEQNRNFQKSGIRHVVAVSGLHVSILFSILYMFVGRNRWLVPLIGIPLLGLFAAIAGFTPSIVRACVMQALMSLSMLSDEEYDPATALSFAVLVLLAVNPVSVTSVGLQLSVACMIGIFLFSEPLRLYILTFGNLRKKSKGKSRRAKCIRWITSSVSISLSALVFTVPLCAIYFGMVSLIGILTNLLTLWVISFIFYGIIISCLAGILLPVAGQLIAWIVSWPIRYVCWISDLLAGFPLAAVYTDSIYIVAWLILSYLILITFFVLKRKYPGLTALGITVLLGFCLAFSWLEPRLYDTQVTVMDVGQGQSILLQSGNEHYLVDCGSTSPEMAAETVANYLLSQGIFRLDGIILTHFDIDHAGAVPYLLSDICADTVYLPDIYDSNELRSIIESAVTDRKVTINKLEKLEIYDGGIQLFPAENQQSDNESSMCVLFQAGDCDILITGDRNRTGERELLAQTELPKLDVLVVGHHGSHFATSHELLSATRPQIAVISVGEDNRYGHPRQEVLERLQLYGCSIQRTDLQGTIIFRR